MHASGKGAPQLRWRHLGPCTARINPQQVPDHLMIHPNGVLSYIITLHPCKPTLCPAGEAASAAAPNAGPRSAPALSGTRLTALENTEAVHNVVVCTLCR